MSNTPRKYRLLKDLPDSKAGDIYIWVEERPLSREAYYKNGDTNESYWLKENVESSPDWFEEIKEEQPAPVKITNLKRYEAFLDGKKNIYRYGFDTNKPIDDKLDSLVRIMEAWLNEGEETIDELMRNYDKDQAEMEFYEKYVYRNWEDVYDFIKTCAKDFDDEPNRAYHRTAEAQKLLKLFEQETTADFQDNEDNIVITMMGNASEYNGKKCWQYTLRTKRQMPGHIFHSLADKINKDLKGWHKIQNAPDVTEEQNEWEVLSLRHRVSKTIIEGYIVQNVIDHKDYGSLAVYEINSVRRTVDGEVFAVGDSVIYKDECFTITQLKQHDISKDSMMAHNSTGGQTNISVLKKLKSRDESSNLFHTEFNKIPFGIYRVHWATGGTGLAAVGGLYDGTRWIAPCNWTHETEDGIASTMSAQKSSISAMELICNQQDEHEKNYNLNKQEQSGVSDEQKEWEIVCLSHPSGVDYMQNDGTPFVKVFIDKILRGEKTEWEIHSVKRNDGVEFKVGDLVEYRRGGDENWEQTWPAKIRLFIPPNTKDKDTKLQVELDDNQEWSQKYYPHKFIENIRHKKSTICGNCGFDSSLHLAPEFNCPST